MGTPLQEEFDFYLDNQDEMVSQYDGMVIVLKNRKVLGAYADELTAISETRKDHELGTFLIQRVSTGDEAYTATFHSRVAFP